MHTQLDDFCKENAMSTDSRIAQILRDKGIELPDPNSPSANYVPFTIAQNLVFIAGQGPRLQGTLRHTGKVGRDITIEQGYGAARLCMLNVLAHLQVACGGNLDRVVRAVRVAGLVNCGPEFTQHPAVINGGSDLLVEIFGDKGKHARIATGACSLPFGMAVEIEAVFEIS